MESPDFFSALAWVPDRLAALPAKAVSRSLLAALCAPDPLRRHRAAELLGLVVAETAGRDMEAGREIMRRLLWSLNEESGTMGWGAPEALAEIMARRQGLACEFAHLLVCLATPGLNPLDNPDLLAGVIWGLGRLASAQPEVAAGLALAPALLPWLGAPAARLRGLAAWALGQACPGQWRAHLEELLEDHSELELYQNGLMNPVSVSALARTALSPKP